MIQLNLYNQGDPRWSKKRLAPSNWTMGEKGCLVTSIASSLKNFAVEDDPEVVCDKLVAVNGFNSSGDLRHEAVTKAYPQLFWYDRVYTTNYPEKSLSRLEITEAIKKIKRLLRLGQPIHIHVDNIVSIPGADHFITAYEWGQDLWLYNPDGGKIEKFSDRYGDPLKSIYGYAAIIGPPIAFPDGGWPEEGNAVWKLSQAVQDKNRELYTREALNHLIG